MTDSIIDKIKEAFVGNNDPLPVGKVEGPVKSRDPSYQGEGMAATYNTHDECGAIPVNKDEKEHAEEVADS